MSKPSSLRLLIAISTALVLGFAFLTWIWHARAQFEEQIVSSQHRSHIVELLGAPDCSFNSKAEMINQIAGGNFVFKQLPAKSKTIAIGELPEIIGTACFYLDALNGDYLVYFDDDKIIAIYWAGT